MEPRAARAIASSASMRFESSMDTSSTTRVSTARQRATAAALPSTFSTSLCCGPLPMPMPANEWSVDPLMCDAAMPVDAVTATRPPGLRASSCWI